MSVRFSIVTPSLNYGRYIETAIGSVTRQEYPDVEHIVVDGESRDGTIDILRRHRHLCWISERDGSPEEAIDRGLRMATGDLVGLLPADDYYEPGAFRKVATYFERHPGAQWVAGYCRIRDDDKREIRRAVTCYKNFLLRRHSFGLLLTENYLSAPAVFFRRELVGEVWRLDLKYREASDYEIWIKIAKKHELGVIRDYLANFRVHHGSITGSAYVRQSYSALMVARRYSAGHPLLLALRAANFAKVIAAYSLLGACSAVRASARSARRS